MNRNIYIYDIEQYKNFHCSIFFNIDTHEYKIFEISERKNDYVALNHFANRKYTCIGFNNLNYDYPMINFLLKSCGRSSQNANELNIKMYNQSQSLINTESSNNRRIYKSIFPNIDLFAIHHFDNKAKRTSLKAVQFEMGSKWVQELPYEYNKKLKIENFDEIITYCKNDISTTYDLFRLTLNKIRLRQKLNSQLGIDFMNMSDSSLGENLILHLYCTKLNLDKKQVKDLRTYYSDFVLGELVFDYISFKKEKYKNLLNIIKNKYLVQGQQEFAFSVNSPCEKFTIDYGLGGIHASDKGIFKKTNKILIIDLDVASLYPNLAIKNNLYINHLGIEFVDVYKTIVDDRLKAKKLSKDKSLSEEERKIQETIADGYKLAANSTYGKSGSEYSFLYDVKYKLGTTINGQLLLTMLIEHLEDLFKFHLIQANTDGITFELHISQVDKMNEIIKNWENISKLELERNDYEAMFIRDCNHYIAYDVFGKVKLKGDYEIDKLIGSEIVYHKDSSFRIVQIAVLDYFKNNIPIKQTIENHKILHDFLGRQKFNTGDYGFIMYYDNDNLFNAPIKERTQKVTRYYVSNSKNRFVKQFGKDEKATSLINKGFYVTLCQILPDEFPTDINYQFYILEAQKLIDGIEKQIVKKKKIEIQQLKLF